MSDQAADLERMNFLGRIGIPAGGGVRAAAAALSAVAACLGVGVLVEWLGDSQSGGAPGEAARARAALAEHATMQAVPARTLQSAQPAAGAVNPPRAGASPAPAPAAAISEAVPARSRPPRAPHRPPAHEAALRAHPSRGAAERPRSGAQHRPARSAPLAANTAKIAQAAALDAEVRLSTAADWRRAAAKVSRSVASPIEVAPFVPSGDDGNECSDVYVYIVSLDIESPHESAASLALSKTEPGRWRQPGHSLGGWEVLAILDDWSGLNPAVWLRRGEEVCRAELEGNAFRQAKNTPRRRKRVRRRR
jgi:hypothetical protein